VDGVAAFVGEDASGSFGILAGHARFMTCLALGLARFRKAQGSWQYLALPGGLLYFRDDVLTLSTRHYLVDADYRRVSAAMQEQVLAEEERLHDIKVSLQGMEEQLFRRLWQLGRSGA
jgi:F-type H+-transporting ATPase subunit epsilon